MPQDLNQPAPNKQATLVVSWYQQQLADAQLQIANLVATNQLIGEQLKAANEKKDPNA